MKLKLATEKDLVEVSGWFSSESEVRVWGGPSMHYPLTLEQLKIDIDWEVAKTYSLVDSLDNLLGFAQVRNRFGYFHLARIVVSPLMRGKKLGYKLMTALLNSVDTKNVGFSLFVYSDNIAAINLYKSIGFEAQSFPEGQLGIEDCLFMVKKT